MNIQLITQFDFQRNMSYKHTFKDNFLYAAPVPKKHTQPYCDNISFTSKTRTNESVLSYNLQKSLSYIKNRRSELEKLGIKLNSFDYLDMSKLNGILYNLSTFKNIKEEDLPLFYNTVGNMLSIGCHNRCYHCFVKAPAIANTYNNSITVVNWEDFSKFCEDTKVLNTRLGFNIFGSDYGKIYPNHDADPISIRIKDKENNFHNIAEVAEKFYDNLNLPLIFDTAGWESDDEFAKNAAIKLCNLVLKRPETISQIRVSLHPFHKLMKVANDNYTRYLNFEDKNSELAKKSYEEYIKNKNLYVERMANVLKEFIPIMGTNLFGIECQYTILTNAYPYSKQQIQEISTEILNKLEEICNKEGIDSSIITSEKNPFKNKLFNPLRKITTIGRNENFSPVRFNSIFHLEMENGKKNITIEPYGVGNFFANNVVDSIRRNSERGIKIFDNVIVNVDLENGVDAVMLKNNFVKSEYEALSNLESNLDNVLSKLPDTSDVKVRFIYDKVNPTKSTFVELLKERICDKYNSLQFEDQSGLEYKNSSSATQDFKEIIDNLSKDEYTNFVKYMTKYIDINGRLGIVILNYPRYGYGNLKERMFYLGDIKLNDNRINTGIR